MDGTPPHPRSRPARSQALAAEADAARTLIGEQYANAAATLRPRAGGGGADEGEGKETDDADAKAEAKGGDDDDAGADGSDDDDLDAAAWLAEVGRGVARRRMSVAVARRCVSIVRWLN